MGNVINRGALITNLAADACVEVPCLVDGPGVWPVAVGALPRNGGVHPARGRHPGADRPRGAQPGPRRDLPRSHAGPDPDGPDLDQAWQLTDELIAAEARWLPAWLGGSA